MSSTNKTTNYNLSQFVGTDVPSWLGDYNGDMSKIDKAIGDVANSQGSVEQSVVGLTTDVQGLSTQVSGVSTSVQQLQTSVAQIDSGYKQADTALSQRITANANNIQTNTTAIESINTTIGTEDISGIGSGTIKGAISDINNSIQNTHWTHLKTETGTTVINLPSKYEELFIEVLINDISILFNIPFISMTDSERNYSNGYFSYSITDTGKYFGTTANLSISKTNAKIISVINSNNSVSTDVTSTSKIAVYYK